MLKFSVILNIPFNEKVNDDFNRKGIVVNYVDDLLEELVIVKAESREIVEKSKFVLEVQDIRKGKLLDIPDIHPRLQMKPFPAISIEPLEKLGLYGLGVKVAVIDSGYDSELNHYVEEVENFTDDVTAEAKVSHGPMVMSLIKNYAYAAKIYSAKVAINDDIDEEHVFRALKWVRSIEGLKIINMSLGFERECSGNCSLSKVTNKMRELGYIIVAAVGNTGEECGQVHCPACAEGVISVGALNQTGDKVASFSCSGHINSSKPNLVAPGHGASTYGGLSYPYYGTSFAAPIVSGIFTALFNEIDVSKLDEYIYESCDKLNKEKISKQGAGKLNLPKLLEVVGNAKSNSRNK